jgi:hypothetical protein
MSIPPIAIANKPNHHTLDQQYTQTLDWTLRANYTPAIGFRQDVVREKDMNGWAGHILDVNLTTGIINKEPLDTKQARLFLGGRGLGARLLWDLVGPSIDPLTPENVLIFATGPLTGTGYQTSNRDDTPTGGPL